ncbi:rab11 family-interacting protein 3 isoform X1 [Oncorhynchus nerka]|uniref:rab11 family-interacting protein 3 isoform X1 n=1 Tax=Oncorhynchus nerka TaxID=8023 RepID=UPI001131FA8C|nr:rab11 family-interacting protein 3 isoform X1 [Oncorhynchus nerka]
MEQTLMSSPLGHSEWDPEGTSSHGFILLDSNKGAIMSQRKGGQTALDFQKVDPDVSLCLEELFQENALNLDSLFRTSSYSGGDKILPWEGDQANHSQDVPLDKPLELSPLKDKIEEHNNVSDSPLPWLLFSKTTDLLRDNSVCEELNSLQDPPVSYTDSVNSHKELITLSEPPSPVKVSDRTPDTNTEASSLLVDYLSSENFTFSPSPAPSGEVNPQGVSKELLLLSLDEDSGFPPPLQGGETVSPETGDKGLFLEPVTDLPTVSNSTPEGLPESSFSHNNIHTDCARESPGVQVGSVPLLDLEVPDCDSSLSLCPTPLESPTCTGASPAEDSEQEHTLATSILTLSEHRGEGDSSLLLNSSPSIEPPSPKFLSNRDASVLGQLPSGCSSEENGPQDLMEDKIIFDFTKHEGEEEMALDPCLTSDVLPDEETWDLKPPEAVQGDSVPALQTEQRDGERLADLDLFAGTTGCHKRDSFDCPVLELNGLSSDSGWTSEQTVETLSLSKMVGSDSMVPIVNQREEDPSPLKAVFDALDQDGDGFVRIEEFMEFAAAYGADQVKDLTKFLDPSGLGVISFEDFHRGISAISNGGTEPQLYDVHFSPGDGAVSCSEEYDEQNEVTDSAYLGSESTYSECETFTDEDTGALVQPEMHEDVETDSGIEATLHDPEDSSNRFSLSSELNSHTLVTVIGGDEEHFEDFGESNTSELLLDTTEEGTEGEGDSSHLQTPDQSNCSSLLLSPSTPTTLPASFQSFLREEALDFFCNQCHKQISRLEDLSTRLNFLEMNSSSKRLSSKKVARHLLQNSSMTLDSMSELSRDILDLADTDITDKVLLLERRVAELEKDSEASGEQHARLRQENLQLVHRANALEEQLKEQELRAEDHLHQETRRHKDALTKLERERGLELENLQARLQQLDEENSELKSCVPCYRANIERLEEEKRKLEDEVEDVTERMNEELETRRKTTDKLTHERHQNQKEKEHTQELIEDLRKQLEHLQLYKLEAEARRGRSPSAGLQEYQSRTREAELEQEIRRLKQDNRSLKEQNDELNGQIINLSIQGAKNLVTASFSESLAAEINSVSRGELMEAIRKQEDVNFRLQDYIDRIIVAIMESNPSMLEVK